MKFTFERLVIKLLTRMLFEVRHPIEGAVHDKVVTDLIEEANAYIDHLGRVEMAELDSGSPQWSHKDYGGHA